MSEPSDHGTFHIHGGQGGQGGPSTQQGIGGSGGVGEGPRVAIDNIANATFNMPKGGEIMFQQRDAILNWLSPINFFQRQADISQLQEKGTGEWLLADPVFKEWQYSSGGTLWCHGIPGAGKTVLVSKVVDYLGKQTKNQKIGVACVYLNHKEVDSQTPSRLLAGLWRQLVDTDVGPLAENLYIKHQKNSTAPFLDEVASILMSRIMELSKIFIIIDAMDEYPEFQRHILLEYLTKIGSKANLMITSRPNISPEHYTFQNLKTLNIRARPEDIHTYIHAQINSPALRHRIPQLQEISIQKDIHTKISGAVDGMFLLAKLHLDLLRTKQTLKAVEQALEELPKDLDNSYTMAMQGIDAQSEDERKTAYSTISWVANAKRPLTVEELLVALAVEPGTHQLDGKNFLTIETILSVCAGLVMVDEELQVVRLAHYTTQEYLDKIQAEKFPDANTKIAHSLLTFLTFDGCPVSTWDAWCLPPLVDYSQYCLAHVAGPPEIQLREILLEFLGRANQWVKVVHRADYMRGKWNSDPWNHIDSLAKPSRLWIAAAANLVQTVEFLLNEEPLPLENAELTIASLYGRTEIIGMLLEKGAQVNAGHRELGSPLQAAAVGGHTEIVAILIEKGADINACGGDYGSSLQIAASRGYTEIVRILLEKGAEIDVAGDYNGTPLQAAALGGYMDIIAMLLDKGANVNTPGRECTCILQAAAFGGHRKIVSTLLEHGADVNAEGGKYGSSLQAAASRGHTKIVRILLDKGAHVNAKGGKYGSSLQAAASKGHTKIVCILLEKGANVDARAGKYGSSLQAAASKGHIEIVCLLLEKGADVNAREGKHGSSLQAAAAQGHTEIVSMLLEKGADINTASRECGSALQAATTGGHREIVHILLEHGADVNTGGGLYGCALQAATTRGHTEIVQMLVAKGADVNTEGGVYGSALRAATITDHKEIVCILLEQGADVNAAGCYFGNSLQAAASKGHTEIVAILLAKGAEVDARGGKYGSSLQAAASKGHTEIVCILLDRCADVNAGGGKYGSSLQAAASKGHTEIVHILLDKGANVNARGGKYGSALQAAAVQGHTEIVGILLEKGADTNARGGEYGSALEAATAEGHTEIVDMLLQVPLRDSHAAKV
ncbi:NACHT and ankyrin domain protein [Mycena sanguinolenta]|uniref:NACHT and ankyrin domain protein n=1 Tax=Mycena sanguinolenta TaxID=230812 RepID=A0A8H6XLD2_9AGAR|nr:NACHT and ankyrin domain protein [Mycena sanguinolenta]